jgi:hypothetical protein
VVGSGGVTGAHAPCHLAKDQHKEQEENACDFQKNDSADAAEGLQKAAYAALRTAPHASGSLLRRTGYGRCGGPAGYSGRLRGGGNPLAGHASGYAHSNAKNLADFLRSHPV